jgi:putative ABC transport system ATP-binding protein
VQASPASVIALDHVSKSYPMAGSWLAVLHDVTLHIAPGEFVAIMGASGSGKSTLMNIIGCLDRPTRGQYRLLGRDISTASRSELADVRNQTLGFVFQNFNLLSRTSALENVELPLVYAGVGSRERRERARAALERVGLGARLDHTPNQLSGGQQQRVAIARALVGNPGVILADEPTGNLDSRTTLEVMELFQELSHSSITLVLVTHEPDLAPFASRVITLKDGRIASDRRQEPVPVVVPPQALDDALEEVPS